MRPSSSHPMSSVEWIRCARMATRFRTAADPPGTVAGLEDHQGEFLARPVGAVALPVEDRGELPGGMDAAETLAVPGPDRPLKMVENPFHAKFVLPS